MIRVAEAALKAGIAVQRDVAEARRALELVRLRDDMLSAADPRCKVLGLVIQELLNRAVLSSLGRANADGSFAPQLVGWKKYATDIRFESNRVRRLVLSLDRGMAAVVRGPLENDDTWTEEDILNELEKQLEVNPELRMTWKYHQHFEADAAIMFLPTEIAKDPEAAANIILSIAVFTARESTRLNALILSLSDSGKPWGSDLKEESSRHLPSSAGQVTGRFRVTPGSVTHLKYSAIADKAEFRAHAAGLMRPFLPFDLLRHHWPKDLQDPDAWKLFGGCGYLLLPAK